MHNEYGWIVRAKQSHRLNCLLNKLGLAETKRKKSPFMCIKLIVSLIFYHWHSQQGEAN